MPAIEPAEIDRRFPATGSELDEVYNQAAHALNIKMAPGRDAAMALTNLEISRMFAVKPEAQTASPALSVATAESSGCCRDGQ